MEITPDSPWPPPGADKLRSRWPSWSAWWSGDLAELRAHAKVTAPGGYWSKRDKHPNDRQIHLPLAGDIARTSAELLFGDSPRLDFGDDAQAEWEAVASEIGWTNTLLEAAETATALGGVYLRPAWDTTVAQHPLVTVVRADEAIPEFRHGRLTSVTFVTDLGDREGFRWRWLEHHERGQIRNELWKGTNVTIGKRMALTDHEATRWLAADDQGGGVLDTTPIRSDGGLLVEYIPNDLPQPLDRQPYGRPDIQGAETLLDALDTAWASWMRDIDLGKSRILVAQEMLDSAATARGGHVETATSKFLDKFRRSSPTRVFDEDAAVFTPVPGMPMDEGGKPAPITPVQFKIRYQEHAETCGALVDEIVGRAGYAPQTFGRHVEGQLSGTAMARRERRSTATQNRKRQYAKSPVERCAETLMLINAAKFDGPKVTRPVLEWPADQADPKENAETVEMLRRAEVMSVRTAVEMAHPEWRETEVDVEVERVLAERPAAPDPSGFETPDQLDPPVP